MKLDYFSLRFSSNCIDFLLQLTNNHLPTSVYIYLQDLHGTQLPTVQRPTGVTVSTDPGELFSFSSNEIDQEIKMLSLMKIFTNLVRLCPSSVQL